MPIEGAIPVESEKLPLLHDVSNVEDLKKLLLSGANINERNNLDETPLLSALRREGDFQLIKEFVLQGADVNAKDTWGVTPLYCAVARHGRDLNIIKFLLENGADIQSGKRAFDRFLDHTVTHNRVCAKLLIRYKFLKNAGLVRDFSSGTNEAERDYYNEYKTIVDLDLKRSSYNFLANYLDDCASEILQMKSVYLCNSVTLLDFVAAKNPLESLVNAQNVQQVINQIYKEFTVNKYKIYKELVVDRIGRKTLLKGLDNKLIYSTVCRSKPCNGKKIILNLDLMYYIAKYLSDIDLFNIVIAFYK
ncbi:unnamed protein product [Larinioides sclopetarius]|uniref:Ankyrin repeat protein n=1 Tax=Larinioides sclopetarius TaxID=280406 RepID=A0AAV2A4V9_9ARAC